MRAGKNRKESRRSMERASDGTEMKKRSSLTTEGCSTSTCVMRHLPDVVYHRFPVRRISSFYIDDGGAAGNLIGWSHDIPYCLVKRHGMVLRHTIHNEQLKREATEQHRHWILRTKDHISRLVRYGQTVLGLAQFLPACEPSHYNTPLHHRTALQQWG